jgi:hypothetical protein
MQLPKVWSLNQRTPFSCSMCCFLFSLVFFFLVCELSRIFFVRQVPSAACTWYYTSTLGYSYFWQNLRFEVTWLYGSPSSNFIFLGGPPAAQAGTLKTKALTGPNMCLRPTTGLVGFICTTWNKSAVSRKYTVSSHIRGTTGHTQDIWWTGKGPQLPNAHVQC